MMKKRIISVLIMISIFFTLIPALNSKAAALSDGVGAVKISTIPMPTEVSKLMCATYTYSGKVLIAYNTSSDINTTDYYNLAVLNDDGTGFKKIFSGVITTKAMAGGIRFMPYKDNTKILLGDYVLECTPTIDTCTSTVLVPITYPSVITSDSNTTSRWSEIIMAPDNKHIAWDSLRVGGSADFVGTLTRQTSSYTIDNVTLFSTVKSVTADPNNSGYIIPASITRGGEVKQFVKGGNAISVVGAKNLVTTDSVVIDLNTTSVNQITNTPGYDETTIFSPDEKLGMVMTTRFSTTTDPAIFGLMPRPMYADSPINGILYSYAVRGVRNGDRSGNVGPALINISKSQNTTGYKGVNLSTDTNWAMESPMSWKPDGKNAMWMESYKGTNGVQRRVQKVKLLEYTPSATVPTAPTPDTISYGTKDLTQYNAIPTSMSGKIAGKTGYIDLSISSTNDYTGSTSATYSNYSSDNLTYYNGTETYNYNYIAESCYTSKVNMTGCKTGTMDLRATWGSMITIPIAKLLFDTASDGKAKSYGYTTYNGTTLNMTSLAP